MAKGFLQNHKLVVLLQNIWATKRNNDTLSMEEGKTIRLSVAAREFNVGVTTILEYLTKKGVKIDSNPNSKLTSDVYALLVKEYQRDRAVKQESEKKSLDISHRQSITIDEKKIFVHEEEEESVREDFLIKSNMEVDEKPRSKPTTPVQAPITPIKPVIAAETKPVEQVVTPTPTVKIEVPEPVKPPIVVATPAPVIETPKPEPVKAPEVTPIPIVEKVYPTEKVHVPEPVSEVKKEEVKPSAPAPAPVSEVKPVIVPESKPVEEKEKPVQQAVPVQEVIKQPAEKPEDIHGTPKTEQHTEKAHPKQHKEAPKAEEAEQNDAALKVLGKLDLDAMNFKTKPERKSREEKKKFRQENARPFTPADTNIPAGSTSTGELASTDSQGPSNADELADALSGDVSVEQLPNYIRAEVKKLEGPTILGSIKLPETRKPDRKKPVASSADDSANKAKKKKRKRIKKDADGNPLPQGQQGTNQNSRPIVPMQPDRKSTRLN